MKCCYTATQHNINAIVYKYDSVPLDVIPKLLLMLEIINAQSSDHDEIETKKHNSDIDVYMHITHHI